MKKWFKLGALALIVVLITGCVDFNAEMEIKKDKSMKLTISEYFDTNGNKSDLPYFSDSDIKKYKDAGFTVSTNVVDEKEGHVLTKEFSNIDNVSSNEQINSIEASKALLDNGKPIFTIKKGIFRNKYYATFQVAEIINRLDMQEIDTRNGNITFNLKVPYKTISDNATSKTNHGKSLEWNLTNLETDQIYFEFYLFNMTNVYIVIGFVGVVLFFVISELRDKSIAKSYYRRKK